MSRRKKNGVEKMSVPEHQAAIRSAIRGRIPAKRTIWTAIVRKNSPRAMRGRYFLLTGNDSPMLHGA